MKFLPFVGIDAPRHRKRRQPVAPPSVTVVSVTIFDDVWADWEFSRPLDLLDEGGPWPMFAIDTSNDTQSPSEGIQVGPTVIRFHFDDGGMAAGQAWRVTAAAPAKLDFHGAVLAWPEGGVLIGE